MVARNLLTQAEGWHQLLTAVPAAESCSMHVPGPASPQGAPLAAPAPVTQAARASTRPPSAQNRDVVARVEPSQALCDVATGTASGIAAGYFIEYFVKKDGSSGRASQHPTARQEELDAAEAAEQESLRRGVQWIEQTAASMQPQQPGMASPQLAKDLECVLKVVRQNRRVLQSTAPAQQAREAAEPAASRPRSDAAQQAADPVQGTDEQGESAAPLQLADAYTQLLMQMGMLRALTEYKRMDGRRATTAQEMKEEEKT